MSAGTERRIVREARENEHRKALYANTPRSQPTYRKLSREVWRPQTLFRRLTKEDYVQDARDNPLWRGGGSKTFKRATERQFKPVKRPVIRRKKSLG